MKLVRVAAAALLAAAALALGAAPAGAHTCYLTAIVPLNQPSNIKAVVAVEGTPVPDVEFTFPPEVHLDAAEPTAAGKLTVSGQRLRYRGPPIPTFTCAYFNVTVTASTRGAYRIGFVQRDAAGKIVAQSVASSNTKLNPYLEQVVYAGMKPPAPASDGPSVTIIAGVALIGLGVVLAIVLAWRNRRARKQDERDEELEERLEAFRSQARDRQPDP